MFGTELTEGSRLYFLNWVLLSAIAVVLCISVMMTHFSLEIERELLKTLSTAAVFATLGHYLALRNWGSRPALVLLSLAQLHILFLLGGQLSYIMASADLPLQDANLANIDHLLGLDWMAYYRFITSRPTLLPYAMFFYAMIGWLGLGVPLLLGLTKHHVRLHQFIAACILTVCVTTLVSALLPAIGTYQQYGLPAETAGFKATGYLVQLEQLPFVRDGALRVLNISKMGGIITFPSFHAAAAILALWACWSVWWIRPLSLITNVGMLMVTPLIGGHYFVDVVAGVALAMLAIATAKKFVAAPAIAADVKRATLPQQA